MAKLRLARDVLERAKNQSNLKAEELAAVEQLLAQEGKGAISAEVSAFPDAFLKALLDDEKLTPNQRAVVVLRLHGMTDSRVDREAIYNTPAASPSEFAGLLSSLGHRAPNCELFFNGRWYPVTMNVQVYRNDEAPGRKSAFLQGTLSLCEVSHHIWYCVHAELFRDEAGHRTPKPVREVLQALGFRPVQTTPAEYNLKLVRAERAARDAGKVVTISGPVVVPATFAWWSHLETRALGTPERPRRAVVESELEVPQEQRAYQAPYSQNGKGVSRLPFVRLFSLDTKAYVYADVDDIAPCQFDKGAMQRLHLPRELLTVLSRVFQTSPHGLFGDLVAGKHGGVVVLACGNPGVGKTLTAEVYAEYTERPLYVLELGELGTNVAQVEEKLQRVFTRVARWNAVLQFDECEIFLARRGEDLERSAIVGIFLRLLDYYQGILFLTTNRWDVLDHAVLSRVMLKLDYPNLDQAARAAIWRTMLESAGLTLVEGTMEELAEGELNGRQIRNLTRLARILHSQGQVTLDQMRAVLRYGCA